MQRASRLPFLALALLASSALVGGVLPAAAGQAPGAASDQDIPVSHQPKQPYVLALSERPNGSGKLEPLSAFTTNPAGSAIVNAVGPIRQIVRGEDHSPRRWLVIAHGTSAKPGSPVPLQAE
jgi:hypothetical protein